MPAAHPSAELARAEDLFHDAMDTWRAVNDSTMRKTAIVSRCEAFGALQPLNIRYRARADMACPGAIRVEYPGTRPSGRGMSGTLPVEKENGRETQVG